MQELTYFTVLLAGVISFISPCVLPLVPPYMCYMAGATIDELTDTGSAHFGVQRKVLINSVLFVLGFTTVFVALGAAASTVGQFVRANMDTLALISGVVIIIMGLHFLGLFKIGLLYREARFQSRGTGAVGAYVMGLAFAFGWTPCIGPVLGVVLGVASTSDTVGQGAFLLAVYSAGLGIPFILAAMFIGPFMKWLSGFKHHLDKVEKAMGAMLVLTGVLFMTGGMQTIAFWMLEQFPALATVG